MSAFLLASLLVLGPPGFILIHTLAGFLLMIPYGVEKIRWRAGAIEVLAKTKKADGRDVTRIWGRPGAQTWGLVIFFARERLLENDEPLHVHERVHALQSLLFGVFYPITYGITFAFFYAIVKLGLDWWDRVPHDNDMWHAYRMIPWERWAYWKEGRFDRGEIVGAWGSFD